MDSNPRPFNPLAGALSAESSQPGCSVFLRANFKWEAGEVSRVCLASLFVQACHPVRWLLRLFVLLAEPAARSEAGMSPSGEGAAWEGLCCAVCGTSTLVQPGTGDTPSARSCQSSGATGDGDLSLSQWELSLVTLMPWTALGTQCFPRKTEGTPSRPSSTVAVEWPAERAGLHVSPLIRALTPTPRPGVAFVCAVVTISSSCRLATAPVALGEHRASGSVNQPLLPAGTPASGSGAEQAQSRVRLLPGAGQAGSRLPHTGAVKGTVG